MNPIWQALFSGLLGSVGAMSGAALLLLFPDATRQRLLPCLLSCATGMLLGAAFLGMLPKALEKTPPLAITGTVLAGIVAFFVLAISAASFIYIAVADLVPDLHRRTGALAPRRWPVRPC